MQFGTQALPTDLLERQFVPFLPVQSLLRLSSSSKSCRAALSNKNESLDLLFWKVRYLRRWKTSKSAPPAADDDKWYDAYKRRHLLDATVRKKLRSPVHGVSASKDPAWQYLIVEGGLDIFNRLYTFASYGSRSSDNSPSEESEEFAPDLGPVDDFERDVARSAIVAINRIDVISKWKGLVSPVEQGGGSSSAATNNIEDGAKLLTRFYVGAERVVDAFSGGRIDHLEKTIDSSLNGLAHKLCVRLLARFENMSESDALTRYAVTDEGGHQFISLVHSEEDHHFSHRATLEEMQHIFRGTGGEDTDGLSGNAEDYYSYKNSLLDQVLNQGLGIPITLSVIYAAVVRRALAVVLDPVGLPGHFILGAPSSGDNGDRRLFIDAFRGGEILSLDEVQSIVASYQVPWDDSFLEAVPYRNVWARMVNNLRACHRRNTILDLFNEQNPARRAMGDDGFTNLLRRVPPEELTELRFQHAMSLSVSVLDPDFVGSMEVEHMVRFVRPVFDRTICSR